jgi:hypothetical protein
VKVISRSSWLVYGWDLTGSKIYGIKKTTGRGRALASICVDTGVETVVSDLDLPPHATLSCYSMARDGKSFITSMNQPAADLWVLAGFERGAALLNFAILWV